MNDLIPAAQAGCKACATLYMAVLGSYKYDWRELHSLLLDITTVPGTLSVWPLKIGVEKHVDKLVLYTFDGCYSIFKPQLPIDFV